MKLVNCIFLIFILFPGCTTHDNSVSVVQLFDYSIEQSMMCYCPHGGEGVKLFVVADTIADAIWTTTGIHLTPTDRKNYRSIKGLFDEITYWDTSSTFQVRTTYDSIYHYPSYISISAKPIIINDTIISSTLDADNAYNTWNYVKYK